MSKAGISHFVHFDDVWVVNREQLGFSCYLTLDPLIGIQLAGLNVSMLVNELDDISLADLRGMFGLLLRFLLLLFSFLLVIVNPLNEASIAASSFCYETQVFVPPEQLLVDESLRCACCYPSVSGFFLH